MKALRHIFLLVAFVLGGPLAFGQVDPLIEALQKYRAGELEEARVLVDQAIATPLHLQDPEAWLLRGFVYKDLFKGAEQPVSDKLRDEGLNSLYTCISLDSAGTYRENAIQAYEYLARSFYNDAAMALNEMDHDRALASFPKYKAALLRLDPKADLRVREIEFYNALGTVYTKRYTSDRTDQTWFDRAVGTYGMVLELDPENYGANYNLATLHFNRGVYKVRRITPEDEIPTILQIQEASRADFQAALPYMLKAHNMNPDRRETLLGLEGIYYSLQDQESSDRFRALFEELPPQEK